MTTTTLRNTFLWFSGRRNRRMIDSRVFGPKISMISTVFGCWHDNLSRPFTRGKTSYRSCLHCGARKQFNAETLETFGSFYASPTNKEDQL
jgi:hypothetical protein